MRALVAMLGLALGVLVGFGLVLLNPVAYFRGLTPLPANLAPAKAYRWDYYRGIDAGIADLLSIGRSDPAVVLRDPALAHVRISIAVLPAGEGTPAALAVKVSAIAEDNSLWRAHLGTLDYWNIFWPGEGSIFASAYSNFWPMTRDSFWAALRGGGRELLDPEYAVTGPPPPGHRSGVTGAAGRYATFTGEIREVLYPAENGPDWTIAIKVNPPPVTPR